MSSNRKSARPGGVGRSSLWTLALFAIIGALIFGACSTGTSDEAARGKQDVASDSPTPSLSASDEVKRKQPWSSVIFGNMGNAILSYAGAEVWTWVSPLVYTNQSMRIEQGLQDLQRDVDKISTDLKSLSSEIDQLFTEVACTAEKNALGSSWDKISNQNDLMQGYTKDKAGQKTWDDWAKGVLENDYIANELDLMYEVLAGSTFKPALTVCAEATLNQLNKPGAGKKVSKQGKFGDQAYWSRMRTLMEWYSLVQVIGLQVFATAAHHEAATFFTKDGGKIDADNVGQQVCGQYHLPSATPSASQSVATTVKRLGTVPGSQRDACLAAQAEFNLLHARLQQELKMVGAGYSEGGITNTVEYVKGDVKGQESPRYYTLQDPQRQYIHAVTADESPQSHIWVTDPSKYPNWTGPNPPGGTAQSARTLTNNRFAGMDGWRGSKTADWNYLIGGLDKAGIFKQYGGYLDRTFNGSVGMKLQGYGSAPIWMDTESHAFFKSSPDIAWCLLIPYSRRNDGNEGLGYPLCEENSLGGGLLPAKSTSSGSSIVTGATSNGWLNGISNSDFRFGDTSYNVAGNYFETDGSSLIFPSWAKSATWGFAGEQKSTTTDTRPLATIWPVKEVGQGVCTPDPVTGKNRKAVTSTGVPTMCGQDFDDWMKAALPTAGEPG